MRHQNLFSFTAWLMLGTGVLKAAGSAPTNGLVILPTITVTATNSTQSLTSPSAGKAAVQKVATPGGFTIKTTQEMKLGRAANFGDLLEGVPGLFLQSENGMEISKISMRGSGIDSADEPLGVEFLLDGVSFNQGDGEAIIEDFDVSTLSYAEVYRGADAIKYGGLTLGGAINLVPHTGYDAPEVSAQLEGGSYGFVRAQASAAGVDGAGDYYASLSARNREGFREHSAENTELLFADIGYKFNDQLENRIYLTTDHTDRLLPGGIDQATLQSDPQAADPSAIALDYDKQWYYTRLADKLSYARGGQQLDAAVYWWHRELRANGYYAPTDYQQGVQIYHADDAGVDLNYVSRSLWFGQQNILTAGLSPAFETERDHNYANLGGTQGQTIARDWELSVNVPLYLQNQHYLTEKLSVLTGLQAVNAWRHFYDDFNDTFDGDQSEAQYFFGLNPKLGLLYEFTEDSQTFVNFSRSFQPPSFDPMVTFDEGAGAGLVYTRLQPQKSWTLEIGTRGHQGRFDWDLSLYHSWLRNELQDLYDAQGNDRGDVNVDRSQHQGIEAGLDVQLWNQGSIGNATGQQLTLKQTYTLNDFHFVDDPVYGNHRLGGIPLQLYEMDLLYEAPCGFYAGPDLQCNLTPYPVDQQNTLEAGAYILPGFKTGVVIPLGKAKFSLFLEAKNLTDKRYAAAVDPIPNGTNPGDPQIFHPGDGRSFYGGVAWNW